LQIPIPLVWGMGGIVGSISYQGVLGSVLRPLAPHPTLSRRERANEARGSGSCREKTCACERVKGEGLCVSQVSGELTFTAAMATMGSIGLERGWRCANTDANPA